MVGWTWEEWEVSALRYIVKKSQITNKKIYIRLKWATGKKERKGKGKREEKKKRRKKKGNKRMRRTHFCFFMFYISDN